MLKLGGAVAKQARRALKTPRCPPELNYLVRWYNDLRAGMGFGFGVNPLSHGEILAYRDLHELPMDSFDVDTLRRLDQTWLSCQPKDEG